MFIILTSSSRHLCRSGSEISISENASLLVSLQTWETEKHMVIIHHPVKGLFICVVRWYIRYWYFLCDTWASCLFLSLCYLFFTCRECFVKILSLNVRMFSDRCVFLLCFLPLSFFRRLKSSLSRSLKTWKLPNTSSVSFFLCPSSFERKFPRYFLKHAKARPRRYPMAIKTFSSSKTSSSMTSMAIRSLTWNKNSGSWWLSPLKGSGGGSWNGMACIIA